MQRRRRGSLLALALVALLASIGANGSARAQTSDAPLDGQFGGFRLSARGNGILLAFDAVGFIPGNPRVLQQGLPEAQATGASGPSFYGLASLDYPGSVAGNLGAIAAQSGGEAIAPSIPGYPVKVEAASPGETPSATTGAGGAAMAVTTGAASSDAVATYAANDLPGFLRSSGMAVHANTHLEDGRAVSQLRAELADIDFAGILHVGAAVTDIRADSDGVLGAAQGATTVTGATFLGLPAVIDGTGIHLVAAPGSATTTTTAKPGPLAPIVDPLASNLPVAGLSPALRTVAGNLSTLLTTTVGQTGTIDDLLRQGGIHIHVLAPTNADNGSVGSLAADGLAIEMTYNPNTNAVLHQLFALQAVQQVDSGLPSDSLVPQVPLNTSPQGLVSLLQQVYGLTITIVPGAVQSEASPPFELPALAPRSGRPAVAPPISPVGVVTTTPFATRAPALVHTGAPGAAAAPSGSTVAEAAPISLTGDATPAWAVVLLLVSTPLWGALSSRLADRSLAASTTACPNHADGPHGGTR